MIKFKLKNWVQASRLASQGYIFFPLFLGQSFAFRETGTFDWMLAVETWLYGVLIQLYIVYANDIADADLDPMNATYTPFSGGSRVLVDQKLTLAQLKTGTIVVMLLNLLLGILLHTQARPFALPFIFLSFGLLWLYSFPPVRLSYRGGGEALQVIGVGLILPTFGFYIQTGTLTTFPIWQLAIQIPLQFACAFSTTMPDTPSDRQGGKHTLAVSQGIANTKRIVLALHVVTLFIMVGVLHPRHSTVAVSIATAICGLPIIGMLTHIQQATPGNRSMYFLVAYSIVQTMTVTATVAILHFIQ
jgi:1,4-dihydroxy-2-naphthoate octaprenyltransferase